MPHLPAATNGGQCPGPCSKGGWARVGCPVAQAQAGNPEAEAEAEAESRRGPRLL
jgi:hypothetical protein